MQPPVFVLVLPLLLPIKATSRCQDQEESKGDWQTNKLKFRSETEITCAGTALHAMPMQQTIAE
jgi:hypothetical protein